MTIRGFQRCNPAFNVIKVYKVVLFLYSSDTTWASKIRNLHLTRKDG